MRFVDPRSLEATERSDRAAAQFPALRQILVACLDKNYELNWEKLKIKSEFPKPPPAVEDRPLSQPPLMPDPTASIYQPPPAPNASDSIYNSRWFAQKARASYELDLLKWKQTCAALRSQYEADVQAAEVRLAACGKLAESKRAADRERALWKRELAAFRAYREAHNAAVDSFRLQYEAASADAVVSHSPPNIKRFGLPDVLSA